MTDIVTSASARDPNVLYSLLPPAVPELPPPLVRGAAVLPGRNALLELLPKQKKIVEVGVALGNFSRLALDICKPSTFIAIDSFRLHEIPGFWGRSSIEHFGGKSHLDWYCCQFEPDVRAGIMQIMEGDSVAMLEGLDDGSIDIFYVDATHLYEPVRQELAVIVRKIKPDGYIIMDDYILVDQLQADQPLGVIYATNEFMIEHGWALHYFALQTNSYYQVALRRADQFSPIAQLEAENASLRRDLALMRSSTSWRISAPLRFVRRLWQRLVIKITQ